MGIPISNYIDIKSKYIKAGSSTVDFSALVFTKEAMLTYSGSGTDPYAQIRADYGTNGKVVTLSKYDALELFDAAGVTYAFLSEYFGYEGAPNHICLFKVGATQTAAEAYTAATANFTNFGSVTFVDSYITTVEGVSTDGRVAVAALLANTNYAFIVQTNSTDYATTCTNFASYKDNVFVVEGNETTFSSTAYVLIAASVCAWYACVNYSNVNSSDTINYRKFSLESATVTTQAGKTAHDSAKCNYIGKVQAHGVESEFMQNGVMLNGVELGVFRDKAWIEASIENGWISMATAYKVPANYTGASKVLALVLGVAADGIYNGSILIDKPLTNQQQSEIIEYTGSEDAVDNVQDKGFFVDAKIVTESDNYYCQYTLVYAKGDSIMKVNGSHYLA